MAAHQARQAQALVLCAEVVDRAYQIRARVQARVGPGERPCAARQTAQTTAEGSVEPFDVGRIDVAQALCRFNDCRDGGLRALIDTARDAHHARPVVLLDDLR